MSPEPPLDPALLQAIESRIDYAIAKNKPLERIFTGVLLVLFLGGMALIGYGLVAQQLTWAIPGSLTEVAIFVPINRLDKLRKSNIRLQAVPQLLLLADTEQRRTLAFDLIQRLIIEA